MMRPYTVAHKLLVANLKNPFKPAKTILVLCYSWSRCGADPEMPRKDIYMTNWLNTHTPDKMVSALFDLSLRGCFVAGLHTSACEPYYTVTLNLDFSKSMKSNIDHSVVKVVSEILSDDPH